MLGLRPPTVSHHLARLAEAGLVSARPESYYNLYRLETAALQALTQRLLSRESLPEMALEVDVDAFDRQVVANFSLPDGRLKALPAQQKKFEAILRYVVRAFDPDTRYTEAQVNDILGRYHEDIASLRRGLVDVKLLARETAGSAYWRTADQQLRLPA